MAAIIFLNFKPDLAFLSYPTPLCHHSHCGLWSWDAAETMSRRGGYGNDAVDVNSRLHIHALCPDATSCRDNSGTKTIIISAFKWQYLGKRNAAKTSQMKAGKSWIF